MKDHYNLDDFDFDLPEDLIAQYPPDRREDSRLFVMERHGLQYRHTRFADLPSELHDGDILVFNDARVIPGRIFVRRETGGRIEMILARQINENEWLVICNRTKRIRTGERLMAEKDNSVIFTVIERVDDYLKVLCNPALRLPVLERIGEVPLPPYIKRPRTGSDTERYQTVYAREEGSVAAPTAGLHFTRELLESISTKGVEQLFLTLHVSWGTFQPVREKDLALHRMHSEHYDLPKTTADALNRARQEKRRIIAVGTTSLRVLESCYTDDYYKEGPGETNIFIYPPRTVHSVDALITNFHTPRSTLLMLVAAFAGYDEIMAAYSEAVKEKYRFFSYGDAMFIA